MAEKHPFEPAPSNSRLSSHFVGLLNRISWDRMTVIGDLNPHRAKSFRNLVANDPRIHFLNGGSDYFKARAYDELFYMEYDKQKGQAFERRNFRCEFNPNNCDEKAKVFFVEKILPNLKDVGFSRLDLAFDVTENLNDFLVMTDIPLKQTVIYGRNGAAETRYFGARDSERYIRIYNKKQERKDNADKEIEFEHLWRVEFELKRQAVDSWDKALDDLTIKQPDIDSIEDVRTQAMIFWVLADLNRWGKLSVNVRSKYRKIIKKMQGKEIHTALKQALEQEKTHLKGELESWIKKSLNS